MKTAEDTRRHRRGRRIALIASNVLLVAAALIGASPWTSGVYTWLVQRRLSSAVAPAHVPAPAQATRTAETSADLVWDGWERQDARDWRTAEEGAPVGRMAIRRLGLEIAVVKGATEADLRRGPGWIPATSPPGRGNCGISGHRTTYLAPFRDIDRLSPGDEIVLETRWRRYAYRVTQRSFLERDDSDILLPTGEPTLTLTSCHPPYTARFRIVVQARLARVERR